MRESFATHYGINPERIDIVPDSIDLNSFRPDIDGSSFRAELGANPNALLIGMVAMIRSEKGHRFFVEAADQILERHPACRFVMVGSATKDSSNIGWLIRQMEQVNHTHGIGSIRLIGFREDIPAIVSGLDIVVIPSINEAQGRTVSEAFACRKPVVASNTGGIPERVIDGVTGLLAEPGNSDDLAAKIMRLIESPELRAQFAQAGFERVQQDGSIGTMMEKTLESYRKAIAQTGRE
ncbi:glycosyltransferase family 4 protein [Oscillatoria laete-virens NRMC-F 0139]|nr:glycosyltransferase family 4 protein [Oscillatoria laete-virens]MDL5055562.1 glycosyltransferase family 4 protein [Oscillatoria laete-virens NRMC-F 0139]